MNARACMNRFRGIVGIITLSQRSAVQVRDECTGQFTLSRLRFSFLHITRALRLAARGGYEPTTEDEKNERDTGQIIPRKNEVHSLVLLEYPPIYSRRRAAEMIDNGRRKNGAG